MHTADVAAPPRELLRAATPVALLRATLFEWAAIAAAWAIIGLGPGWVYLPLALFIAGRVHALASIAHDGAHLAVHGRASKADVWAARIAEALSGWPIGTSWASLRAHHLRHHADTNLGTDPYLRLGLEHAGAWRLFGAWLSLFLLYPHWVLRCALGAVASVFPPLLPAYARLLVVRRNARLPSGAELHRCARADRPLLLALTLLFAAALTWPETLTRCFFFPLLLTLALNGRRFLAEHTHAPARGRSHMDVLTVTRDTGTGWLSKLLWAPRGLGYHRVHHLHPNVAHDALPALHAWYSAHHPGFAAEGALVTAAPFPAPQRAAG